MDCVPRVYFNCGGGAVRPSICVSASSFGSWPWEAEYTEILTELEPALTERMILDILRAVVASEAFKSNWSLGTTAEEVVYLEFLVEKQTNCPSMPLHLKIRR